MTQNENFLKKQNEQNQKWLITKEKELQGAY